MLLSADDNPFDDSEYEQMIAHLNEVPDDERALVMKFFETNDQVAFEKELMALYVKRGQMSAEDVVQMNEAKKTEQAVSSISASVYELILHHFDRTSKKLQKAALAEENRLLGIPSPQISIKHSAELVNSANPFVRLMLASHGLHADILKNDPLAKVRLEVLKQTGVYADDFQETERDYGVIKELISQGVGHAFYRQLSEATREMVETQESANQFIKLIEQGALDVYEQLMAGLAEHSALVERYKDGMVYLTMCCAR
jgi:flagellar hook-basal body complex protein FliE